MEYDFLGDVAIFLVIVGGFCGLLGIGGLIADYILPHIPAGQRYLDSLPDWDDEDDDE